MGKTIRAVATITVVPLSQIEPDANQPRKNFDAARLGELMKSIDKLGIKNPLVVQKTGSGKLKLVDGERRYRASKELGLKEVPVIIEEETSDTELLIEQFHLQEQHEGWSATERALAVIKLSEQMHLSVSEVAQTLSLSERTIGDYMAFAKIIDKREFLKSEMPISYSGNIVSLKVFVKRQYQNVLEEEFTKEDEAKLEKAVIHRFKIGDITRKKDILKIRDAVQKDPRNIEKFIKNDGLTTTKLFLQSDAKKQWIYRNIRNYCNSMNTHLSQGLALGVEDVFVGDDTTVTSLKKVHASLGKLISRIKV